MEHKAQLQQIGKLLRHIGAKKRLQSSDAEPRGLNAKFFQA